MRPLLVLLAACNLGTPEATPEPGPVAVQAPPGDLHPNSLTLHVGELYEGRPLVVTLEGIPAGPHRAELALGGTGAGACPAELGGLCLDVSAPLTRVATFEKTPRGDVAVIPWNPAWGTGAALRFQAAATYGGEFASSQVVTRRATVQPSDTSNWDSGSEPCLTALRPTLDRGARWADLSQRCSPGPSDRIFRGTCTDPNGVTYDVLQQSHMYGAYRWYFALNGTPVAKFESTDCNCFCGGSFIRWEGFDMSQCLISWTYRC